MTDHVRRFRDERWTLGVVGLGYVGLPLALTASEAGLPVIGYDRDLDVVAALKDGRSHVSDVSDAALRDARDAGLEVSDDPAVLRDADAILICVPSPLGRDRLPDMSYIEDAVATIAEVARPGQLISLESTTYPGTTDELIVPALTARLELDREVFVAYSPERVDPGSDRPLAAIPKVVGGVSPASRDVAVAAYGRFIDTVHAVSSARAAELTKLLENTYRAVNIALVNELAQLAHVLGIDLWEVVSAAETKPFGFEAFRPGPGVGGHCIPLDPQYLAWRARELRFPTRFIDLADHVNATMPNYVVQRVVDVLNQQGRAVRGATILVVGLAYKPNVADERESPSLPVVAGLADRGAELAGLDPHVPTDRIRAHGLEPVADGWPVDRRWDLALILTDHDAVDYERVAGAAEVVFDTRDAYRRRGLDPDHVVRL